MVRPAADQLLAATMLAWGNVVATSLLLSRLHRLDDPLWFLGTSAAIAGLICSVLFRVRPAPIPSVSPVSAKASRINPWLLGAFSLVTAALALGSIAVSCRCTRGTRHVGESARHLLSASLLRLVLAGRAPSFDGQTRITTGSSALCWLPVGCRRQCRRILAALSPQRFSRSAGSDRHSPTALPCGPDRAVAPAAALARTPSPWAIPVGSSPGTSPAWQWRSGRIPRQLWTPPGCKA